MLNFAIVGCGRIAKRHAEILGTGQIAGARLVAVCDVVESRARAFGEKYSLPFFTDCHRMMHAAGAKIDVISIATPSGTHAGVCLDLVSYRKHFVVEKPMALTLQDADAMIEACERAGVRLFVVKQNRYNLPVVKLREALEAGRFGKLVMGTVRVRWCRTQDYYDQDAWRGTWADDGGVFANQASHHVDLLQWMMGDVETVYAQSATRLVDIEVEDTGAAVLRFSNGALGVIEATTATRPRDLEGSISILGEHGTVEIDGFAVNRMKTWMFRDGIDSDREVLERYRENPPNVYGFGHQRFLQDVVDCILHDRPGAVDGRAGRRSLELITAIYESIESGGAVSLPLRPEKSRLGRRAGSACPDPHRESARAAVTAHGARFPAP
jgi:UDP-N-acetyl-2-amino-2-deoxyglucuronate dehydrogenase